MTALIISEISIHQDSVGRFRLNDFHKAAGGAQKQKPSEWLRNQQTRDLINEIIEAGNPASEQNQPVNVLKGGNVSLQGVYVVKELVYAYAMWISASFHLRVIRAYDALATGQHPETRIVALQQQVIDLQQKLLAQLQLPRPVEFGKPRRWTPEEDRQLLYWRSQGLGDTRVGYKLGRNTNAVGNRRRRLQGGAS